MDRVAGILGGSRVALPDHATLSDALLRFGLALAVAAIGFWLSKLLSRALDRLLLRFGVEQILRDFLRGLAHAIGVVVVAVAALDALGVPTTSLLAVLGAAGLAIGLALKDSLSNIASGVMLIVLRPFRAGDAVVIAGQEGIVEQVRIFQTVLRTYQNHDVILPNSQITTAPIVNYTSRPQRRIDLPVGIGYDDDLGRARTLLLELAASTPGVRAEPVPEVQVMALGESSVDLVLRAWVDTADFGVVRSALLEAIGREFARAGVTIPYPQRDLHVYHHDADGRPLPQITNAIDDPDRG
jgi:small conductance mechanosensitive channel